MLSGQQLGDWSGRGRREAAGRFGTERSCEIAGKGGGRRVTTAAAQAETGTGNRVGPFLLRRPGGKREGPPLPAQKHSPNTSGCNLRAGLADSRLSKNFEQEPVHSPRLEVPVWGRGLGQSGGLTSKPPGRKWRQRGLVM